jgi:hypothetical protein
VADAAHGRGYTYLYIRMLRNPSRYRIPVEAREDDPKLEQCRASLVHTAAQQLKKLHLSKFDRKAGNFQTTDLKLLHISKDDEKALQEESELKEITEKLQKHEQEVASLDKQDQQALEEKVLQKESELKETREKLQE